MASSSEAGNTPPVSNASHVERGVSEVYAGTHRVGMGRVVQLVDRFFPLVWIGLYALLPMSGWAEIMFDSWYDQKVYIEALRSVLTDGRADLIAADILGPAYIAAAAFVHKTTGLGLEDSFVALNRVSYALSIAAGLVLVRVFIRRTTSAPPFISLSAQLVFVALVFAAGTWYWSDVPWSHFFAGFLAVTLLALRFAPTRIGPVTAALVGVVVALLALTRTFEFLALVLAWVIALAVLWLLRLHRPKSPGLSQLLAGVGALVVTVAAVYLATGKSDVFFLYGSNLDRQSAAVQSAEIATTPTFSVGLVPIKLVQLFVEPCFYASCEVADYAGGADEGLPLPLEDSSGQERLWRLPLAVQLPSLVLLPLCVLAVGGLLGWFVRRREVASARTRELRLVLEMTIAASGIVLGYAASTLTGSAHLRYGYAREFLLPALLTGIVAVSLVSAGLWLALSRFRRASRPSSEILFVGACVVGSVLMVGIVAIGRSEGLPRLEGKRLESVAYRARCHGDTCDVAILAESTSGRRISIPEASTLTFGCGSEEPRFTVYAKRPSEGVRIAQSCADPRLVAAWPTVMGLPPGTYELQAVSVTNL